MRKWIIRSLGMLAVLGLGTVAYQVGNMNGRAQAASVKHAMKPLPASAKGVAGKGVRRAPVFPVNDAASAQVDRRVRIPQNTEAELQRLVEALDLSETEQLKTKNLLKAYEFAGTLVQKYQEPVRTKKQLQLQRQFRLSMYTVLPKEKEPLLDDYLTRDANARQDGI